MEPRISFACQQHILQRAATLSQRQIQPTEQPLSTTSARCSSSMAPSLGFQRLICFYCGRRSATKQDGTIREWKCENCDAVNYLDENGEITDPPVAVVERSSDTKQYAAIQPRGEVLSPSTSNNSLFCNDCLKNQHLFRSSLAQYVPDERETFAVDRNYLKFKESLELRYPQVCEECLNGVVDRLKQSSYTAKTDHLRRLLAKTKRNGAAGKNQKTWQDIFQFLGLLLWRLGIYGQLVWNIAGGSVHVRRRLLKFIEYDQPLLETSLPDSPILTMLELWTVHLLQSMDIIEPILNLFNHYGITISNISKWGLWLSLASLWWNPKFKEGFRGYHQHIKGFYDWYRYQTLLLLARAAFWYVMGLETFSGLNSSAALGAHLFMFLFTISVVEKAWKCIKVDFGPLFAPTSPERLLPYVRRKDKSKYNGRDMSQALTSIMDESTPPRSASLTTRGADPFYNRSPQSRSNVSNNLNGRSSSPYGSSQRQSQSPGLLDGLEMDPSIPSLSLMTEDESFKYLLSGEIPAHMQGHTGPEYSPDAMEWDPESSQHRAFQPVRAPRQSQLFSQAPVNPDPSPFWYKGLPQAPISQAHRARNPPNVPRLQPASEEAKINFFNRLAGNQPSSFQQGSGTPPPREESPLAESRCEFAQQRFFPDGPKDAANGLSEMFEQAFTLKSDEAEIQGAAPGAPVPIQNDRRRHKLTALVLLVGWIAWNHSFAHPQFGALGSPLVVMVACGAIALRSITDWIQPSLSKGHLSVRNAAGAFIGLAQTIAAAYGISEFFGGTLYYYGGWTQGSILIGVMFLEEIYLALSSQ